MEMMKLNGILLKMYNLIWFIPSFVFISLQSWIFYFYCRNCWQGNIYDGYTKIVCLVLSSVLFLLILVSYVRFVSTPLTHPPKEFRLSENQMLFIKSCKNSKERKQYLDMLGFNLPIFCRTIDGEIRFCEHCSCLKPDRCHHCFLCGFCVLKMDHHCPLTNKCVGHANYKLFFLFGLYTFMFELFITVSVSYSEYLLVDDGNALYEMWHFALFSTIVGGTALTIHFILISLNITTISLLFSPHFISTSSRSTFNLGFKKNFMQVFGNDVKNWMACTSSIVGDGIRFPLNPSISDNMFKQYFVWKLQVNEGHWHLNEMKQSHEINLGITLDDGTFRKRIKKIWIQVATVTVNIVTLFALFFFLRII